jgi:transcriptional regulator with XRE-family HTH domain
MDVGHVGKVIAVIRKNRRLTVREVAEEVGIRKGSCYLILIPKFKSSIKGRRFQTVEEIEENSIRDVCAIPQNSFPDVFQN